MYSEIATNGLSLTPDIIQFNDHRSSIDAFEFLATNIAVEWGLVKTKNEENFEFFVTTTHHTSTNPANRILRDNLLIPSNYRIMTMIHSHPGNTAKPSGLGSSESDIGFSIQTKEMYKKENNIIFMIFTPINKEYIMYDENSKTEDF